MSEFGEKIDRILELTSEKEKLSINELEEKITPLDKEILNFMNHEGLIVLKKGEVRITEFGLRLLNIK